MARNPGLNRAYTDGMQAELDAIGRPPGTVFYVNSSTTGASDTTSDGLSWAKPLATIQAAVDKCTANVGDKIYVGPGHTESIAAAADLAFDCAGIECIGFGVGTNRPTISLGTATTADIDIDAANVTIKNIRFVSAIDSLAVVLDVNAGNFTVEGCDFIGASTLEIVCAIDIATTKDDFVIRDCYFYQPTDPGGTSGNASTGCIYLVDSENILIERCAFIGQWETAFVHNKTTLAQELWIKDCYGTAELSGSLVMILVDDATGGMVNCHFAVPNAADVAEASFMTIAATTTFGVHACTFMNDGAGGNAAIAIAAAT